MISKKLNDKGIVLLMIAIITLQACIPMKEKVDFILINGKVYTVNDSFQMMEAFAVKDGRFIAMGETEYIMSAYKSDVVYDAGNHPVYPGLIDGHSHFYGYGENLYRYADLKGTHSFDEVLERLKAHYSAHPSEWILGRGWDQNDWEGQRFPDNEALENLFSDKKILLIRIDGHASLASKAALEAAGINKNTVVPGGEVVLNESGNPSGILIDNADQAVKNLVSKLTDAEKEIALLEAQQNCFAVGLTSVTDAGLPYQTIELIRKLQNEGKLKIRINAWIDPDKETMEYYLPRGPQVTDLLTVNAVKMYADGALGSRGAKLLQPYTDEPSKTGLILHDSSFYEEVARQAYNAGFQVNMHAIGDSAVRFVLDLYASFLNDKNDRRWRVEHSQVVHSEDFDLYGQYNIIPSIQSTHATSDMGWAGDRLGSERLKGAYAQKQLLEQNGWIVNGTDFPIEGINPVGTFFSAVFRKNLEGFPENGFQMENALTREEALRSMTIWAAKGSFEENLKGSIEKGKLADFVIFNRDIMEVSEQDVLECKPLVVYSSGVKVFGQN
jgi:hypothetical protein